MASPAPPGPSDNIDVVGARAVVEWSSHDGQSCYLCSNEIDASESGQIALDLHFRPSSGTALFRLRAPMMLKGLGRKTTPFYIFISPERIQECVFESVEEPVLPDVVRKNLGGVGIYTLRFSLTQPANLVVPPHDPLVPKKKAYWDMFDSLRLLAQQRNFAIYVNQESIPAAEALLPLRAALSAGSLATSIPHADISRLYDGKGGQILMGSALAISVSKIPESPPSYDEAGPSPPAPPEKQALTQNESSSSSKKRRRRSSSVVEHDTGRDATQAESSVDTGQVEAICRKLMNEMNAKYRQEGEQLRGELRQMETRIQEWVDGRLGKHLDDIREEMRHAQVRQQDHVDGHVQDLKLEVQEAQDVTQETWTQVEEVGQEVQRLRDEVPDIVDGKLDESMESLRADIKEYLTDELIDSEQRVIDRIKSSVYIDFNIYE